MTNPFRGLPATNFWSQAVSLAPMGGLDPVVSTKFRIGVDDKVATMGSCFAQHISRYLERVGLTYFVTEDRPVGVTADEADARNFRVFSARFGNVYTVRQALQLFDRAFGRFSPAEHIWHKGDRVVDPFRPQIEPDGHDSIDAMSASRDAHLASVRTMFTECAVLVFTLGLTEGWASRIDGAVYPVAPGVHGGDYDPQHHTFVNFRVDEVIADLEQLLARVREVNPAARVLLTVSPVPLIATFEPRHVLTSTVVSKAILRVAADEIVRRHDHVEYFPSFEIISGSAIGAQYFEPDLRQVSQRGVDHVMRVFAAHMIDRSSEATAAGVANDRLVDWSTGNAPNDSAQRNVVCDEELIEAALRSSGVELPPGAAR